MSWKAPEIPVVISKPPTTSLVTQGWTRKKACCFSIFSLYPPQIRGCKSRLKFRSWPHPLVLGPLADG